MNLILIPARGGSKRIPKKNIKLFNGRPIIEWSIEQALKTNTFNKVVVSTDDEEIAMISKLAGAEVPFIRPKEFSSDFATTSEVVQHSIRWFQKKGILFEYVCCLYPTSPFVKSSFLSNALNELKNCKKEVFVISAASYASPIQRAFYIDENGFSKMFDKNSFELRTQDLKKAYHDAAQFYLASSKTWLNQKNIFDNSKPFLLPRLFVQDIDTLEDWEDAEIIFEVLLARAKNKET